ncbi:uncharacterized protein FOMMEDRAFT_166375 [Fomitiporia mediterranea MF3/22]|uniref:uncharacterized protein n=1 Tax=Fomitiporia mediterranea (strain MF3/22) TaxID=694068 RepID=UPI00044092F4|nr:uncharacterized protein FOMMEDRAFT_166375 [Fomitiporia mediterranea MF3/22]EJD06096.1 hypothetical protein FOMMEDRAFT_166375 [Fomitiporia mediterranea MF3/22]
MAYVPPHLRNKQSLSSQVDSAPRSLESLQTTAKSRSSLDRTYTSDDLASLLEITRNGLSTLTVATSAAAEQSEHTERGLDDGILKAIVLFEGQHPEWQNNHKVLCKSNLQVLHTLIEDQKRSSDDDAVAESHALNADYPIFREIPFMKNKFEFVGWWKIDNVDFLAPGSAELVSLFEKKFGKQNEHKNSSPFSIQRHKPKARTEQAWRDGLSREWAVVKLVQNHTRKDSPELSLMPTPSNGLELSREAEDVADVSNTAIQGTST